LVLDEDDGEVLDGVALLVLVEGDVADVLPCWEEDD
jgi:hypothetical protein